MGITEILTVILFAMKLAGTIDWPWWLVFLPEIIACVVYHILFFIAAIRNYRVAGYVNGLFRRR